MKRVSDLRRIFLVTFLTVLIGAAVCIVGCGKVIDSLRKPNMTPLSPRLQSLFDETKTVCFGRFVVLIPATAVVVFGPAEAGSFISYLPGEAHLLSQHIASDLKAAENSRDFFDEDDVAQLPLFGKVIDGILPGQKLTFDSKDRVGYYINSYIPLGQHLFVQHVGSVMHQEYSPELFNDVARHIRLRDNDEVPEEPGSCIDGAFLPMALEYERVTIGIRLKEFPDVHLSIKVHKNRDRLEESAGLELTLKRAEEMAQTFGHGDAYARIKTFRRGPRDLGPWKGDEMVARKPAYHKDTEAHEFHFHSLGALHDPLHPQIDVRFDSGVKNNRTARTKPSLTDEEAVALWDKLIGSIRVRPTRATKAGNGLAAQLPLGALKATGEICTQRGWWQSIDEGSFEGGQRRLFSEGERMPHSIVLDVPNLWQMLTGDRPRHFSTTVWRLVSYET